jgi:hypothetical protein
MGNALAAQESEHGSLLHPVKRATSAPISASSSGDTKWENLIGSVKNVVRKLSIMEIRACMKN